MNLSCRIKNMQYSPIRKLSKYANEASKEGIKVYSLNIGQPDIETPSIFFEELKNFKQKVLKYTDSSGISPLKQSFIKYYSGFGYDFSEDELIITNGGSEAFLFTLLTICDEKEEILIPEPFYTNYNSFAQIAGVKIVPLPTKAEENFHLPCKEDILSRITDKTKAIAITTPGNPTGAVYSYDEIKMLCEIAKEKDLFIISDEVYREFVYDNLTYTSPLDFKECEDRVIVIDSISKRYSACGARIGMIVSKNKEVISQVLKLCQARLCVPTIEQVAAVTLINTKPEYFKAVKDEYQERRDILFKGLSKIKGVICSKAEGAFYIMASLPVKDSEHFSKWLLTDFNYNGKTVMLAPANGFYNTKNSGMNLVRLSYCINKESLIDAVQVLEKALDEYHKINKNNN